MSNFICPTCGMNNIDCGQAGYKTDREIELEKKLSIAVKALEKYARHNDWYNCRDEKTEDIYINSGYFLNGYETAQEALAKIKEIK